MLRARACSTRRDERVHARAGLAGVHADQRAAVGQGEGVAHRRVTEDVGAREGVGRDHERQPPVLEVVDRREAVVDPAQVDQDHRADRAPGQLVPHEPEPRLAGGAEQVQDQLLVDGDAAEVHGHRGRGLVRHGGGVVDPDRQRRSCCCFGGQRRDLRHRPDEGGLAGAEPAGDQDLERDQLPAGSAAAAAGCQRARSPSSSLPKISWPGPPSPSAACGRWTSR